MKELLVCIFFLGVTMGVGVGLVLRTDTARNDIDSAVSECEAELPRNQHCEYRIEAFVAEGE